MDQDRQRAAAGNASPADRRARSASARARPSHDRVDVLQVAGVGGERDVDPLALARDVVAVAPWWYFTSPVPPRGRAVITSMSFSPSNSARISSYGRPTACASTFSRPRCAIPRNASRTPASTARPKVSSSIGIKRVEPLDREALGAEEGRGAGRPRAPPRRSGVRAPRAAPRGDSGRRYLPDSIRCRSQTRFGGRRCARSRRRSCRCRSRAGGGAPRPAWRRALDPQDVGRDLLHHLGRQPDRGRLQCRVADWLRAEGVQVGGEVAVHPVCLDQRRGGLHVGEHLLGRALGSGAGRRRGAVFGGAAGGSSPKLRKTSS